MGIWILWYLRNVMMVKSKKFNLDSPPISEADKAEILLI
jgi:hypothetical protein